MTVTYTSFEQDGEWWDEGEHCPLIHVGGNNLKYTHHPIAAAQDMNEDLSFRHLSFEQLFNAVVKYGPTRSNSWNRFCYVDRSVVPMPETKRAVATHLGAKCLCCENMAWEPPPPNSSGWGLTCKDLDAFDETISAQIEYVCALLPRFQVGLHSKYPVLCSDCVALARTAKPHPGRSWRYERTNALRGVLAVFEQKAVYKRQPHPVGC
jgi:hypothetical protein